MLELSDDESLMAIAWEKAELKPCLRLWWLGLASGHRPSRLVLDGCSPAIRAIEQRVATGCGHTWGAMPARKAPFTRLTKIVVAELAAADS